MLATQLVGLSYNAGGLWEAYFLHFRPRAEALNMYAYVTAMYDVRVANGARTVVHNALLALVQYLL